MFDIAPTELLLCAVIALVVIGPKDLPKAMRLVGRWMAKARAMASHFRVGVDAMVREAELAELEKDWAERNRRIMERHPGAVAQTRDEAGSAPDAPVPSPDLSHGPGPIIPLPTSEGTERAS